jgi:hypothetical protein
MLPTTIHKHNKFRRRNTSVTTCGDWERTFIFQLTISHEVSYSDIDKNLQSNINFTSKYSTALSLLPQNFRVYLLYTSNMHEKFLELQCCLEQIPSINMNYINVSLRQFLMLLVIF